MAQQQAAMLIALAVCGALCACSPVENKASDTTDAAPKTSSEAAGQLRVDHTQTVPPVPSQSTANLTQHPDINADFSSWVESYEAMNQEPTLRVFLEKAIDAPSIRSRVKNSQGGLQGEQFCRYLASPDFGEIAGKIMGKPVVVTYEPTKTKDQPFTRTYPPNSIVLSIEPVESGQSGLYGHSVKEDGSVGIGLPLKEFPAGGDL